MEKINIAELLKNCPSGMELDCTMYDNLYFDKVVEDFRYPIGCYTIYDGCRTSVNFTEFGEFNNYGTAKCVIFPKGKNTWEGFQRPFIDGDIISDNRFNTVCIFKGEGNIKGTVDFYCGISGISKTCGGDGFIVKDNKNQNWHFGDIDGYNFATKEERQELFQAINNNGYKWNEKTKTLEKLIIPKFKVGDRIRHKIVNFIHVITGIKDEYYIMDEVSFPHGILPIEAQNEYESVPDKFDFTTLKPFDKVLVRGNNHKWKIQFFEKFDEKSIYPFVCMDGRHSLCIPYNGNEYLHDTTNSCSDYYQI